jgi:aspartyl-tRNA(Asn)/glutamyl-tRNA(Gln) amidotransferase subunit A
MTDNPNTDDLFSRGIRPWAESVRRGSMTFTRSVAHCLQRVQDNQSLDAFECVDSSRALATAAALDALLEQGTDLGPLMGLPMGVKDIMVVDGLPTTNGSNADTAALTSTQEGSVVRRLRQAGAVPLGKTRTVEFALGATGVNESRGTPWNPVDRQVHRIPGGSSSGSAVAAASGMVGVALGSDTGGSIRIPACFTGIVGLKTSVGIWPTDGVFPLSPTLDSIGPLCRTVDDAALLHTVMTGEPVADRPDVNGLRLGIVEELFFDALDPQVAEDFERACQLLERHGATRVRIPFPEVHERTSLFTSIVPAELISYMGPEFFNANRQGMDSVTAARAAVGLETSAHAYVGAQRRRRMLAEKARATFNEVDVWLSPTCPFVPMPLADLSTAGGHERSLLASRNTQPGNLMEMCGVSLPMHASGLPTGLQMTMPLNHDARLLAVSRAVERVLSSR